MLRSGHIGLLAVRLGTRLVQVDVNPVPHRPPRPARAGARGRVASETPLEDPRGPTGRAVRHDGPPYLPHAEIGTYPEDPEVAVDGGPDGLAWCGNASR